jgi:hypothetical protein
VRLSSVLSVTAITAVLLTGCGDDASGSPEGLVVDGEPAEAPYDGPMTVGAEGTSGGGVAGLALECDGEAYGGGSIDYNDGLAEVQGSKTAALGNGMDPSVLPTFEMPTEGYRLERDEDDRALFSYDVSGKSKIAIVVADGMEDYLGNEGWGIEWWAQCDPSELSAAVTDALGVGIWQDEAGRRFPVTEIRSYQGAEHCSWEALTFLQADFLEPHVLFVRDTEEVLRDLLATTFATVDHLPDGASDTGYHRDGRALWLTSEPDAAYLVNDADPGDIERWPAAIEPIGCA